ncbi:hypothetical protein MMC26_001489 [Xylographa opegraphella]|nr:hypothetical protein [Xylographa opegraphella]
MDTPPEGGDVDQAPLLDGVSWSLTCVALCFVVTRVYSRIRLTNNMWFDDWFIILTMVLTLSFTIIWTVYGQVGGCRHVYYLSIPQQESATKLNWISQAFCIMAIAFGKVSVAFLILRLGPRDKLRRRLLYFAAASMTILYTVESIITFAQCSPPRALWTFDLPARCWPSKALTISALTLSAYSALLDIVLPCIAVSIIWKLQMPLRKKIELSMILSTGLFACVCACVKMSYLPALETIGADFTWDTVTLFIWNTVEINVVIIAACIPALRPVYLLIFRRPGAEAYSSRNKSHQMHSVGREAPVPLKPNTNSDADPPNGWEDRTNLVSFPTHSGIMQTVDLDVDFEDAVPRQPRNCVPMDGRAMV